MSQVLTRSPKHCAKKGFSNLEFLNNKLFKILSTFVFSILSLILLLWFILHPTKPQFILQQVDVYQLNFSSPNLIINSAIEITFESRNPNQKVGIYYEQLKAYASYKDQQITEDTSIPPFYQGQQDSNLLSASLCGPGLAVGPMLVYEMGRAREAGKLVLILKVNGKIRWKVGTWVSRWYRMSVDCVAILPLGPLNPIGSLSYKQGTQCSTTI